MVALKSLTFSQIWWSYYSPSSEIKFLFHFLRNRKQPVKCDNTDSLIWGLNWIFWTGLAECMHSKKSRTVSRADAQPSLLPKLLSNLLRKLQEYGAFTAWFDQNGSIRSNLQYTAPAGNSAKQLKSFSLLPGTPRLGNLFHGRRVFIGFSLKRVVFILERMCQIDQRYL